MSGAQRRRSARTLCAIGRLSATHPRASKQSRHRFPIGAAGDYVGFWFADPAIVEQIAANTQVELYGSAGASVGTSGVSTIALSWDGEFEYSQTECESKNHQLILTRR